MQVTRQSLSSLETPSRRDRPPTPRRRPGATAGVLAGAGVTYASTEVFGHNQVGTEYANGLQVSDNQILKPLGDRLVTEFGKFMGSTVSPDGRFLAATSTDKSVVAADLRPLELQADLDGWHRSRGQPEAHQQHRRSGRPDVLAGRQVPLDPAADRPDPVPGQRRRHARHADAVPIPTVTATPPWWARSRTPPTGHAVRGVNGQNTVVALDPNTGAIQRP